MSFDEFSQKLQAVKEDFRKSFGRDIATIRELEEYLVRRKLSQGGAKKARNLKSLKGFDL